MQNKPLNKNIAFMIVFIFFNSFGFPGNFTRVFGSMFGMLVEYISFFFQLIIMLLSSGDSVMDIKLFSFKKKYIPVYFFIAVVFVTSMLVTSNRKEQLISCIRLSVTALFALWLCENLKIEEILELAYYAQILFVLANLVFVTVFSRYVYRESTSYAKDFVGIFSAKNGAGTEFTFGILLQLTYLRIRRGREQNLPKFFILVFFVQLLLLIMTHNVGAMFAGGVALVYIWLIYKGEGHARLPLGYLYIAMTIAFLFAALTILPLFTPFFESIGKDATLTGRVPLWEQIISLMQKSHTLMGYGYGMFWRNDAAIQMLHNGFGRNTFMHDMVSGAHNYVLELWLNIGLLGVAAFFGAVFFSFRNITALEEDQYIFCAAYLLMFMVYGFTERASGTYEYLILFMYLMLGMGNNWEQEKRETFIRSAQSYIST